MKLPNWLYDILKWLCLLGLPALGGLYSGLAAKWGWPNAEQISGTCSDIGDFLGVVIGISSAGYAWEQWNQGKKESDTRLTSVSGGVPESPPQLQEGGGSDENH